MVLGNDFGTVEYVEKHCPDNREREQNATLKNLLVLNLDRETTFFTNLYLGLRTHGKNTDEKKIELQRPSAINFYRLAHCVLFYATMALA
jgi:hypothetical protein